MGALRRQSLFVLVNVFEPMSMLMSDQTAFETCCSDSNE